jgi:hypothetical protein
MDHHPSRMTGVIKNGLPERAEIALMVMAIWVMPILMNQ